MNINKNNRKSGMTLIEILVVIALIGILAGVLVRAVGGSFESGKRSVARLFCETTVKNAILAYETSHGGKLPLTKDDLIKELKDAAGEDVLKSPLGGEYSVFVCPDPGVKLDKVQGQPEIRYAVISTGIPLDEVKAAVNGALCDTNSTSIAAAKAAAELAVSNLNDSSSTGACGVHF